MGSQKYANGDEFIPPCFFIKLYIEIMSFNCRQENRRIMPNYRGASFDPVRVHHPHKIVREGFRAGTQRVPDEKIPSLKQLLTQRKGLGNRDITRPNFNAPRVLPRDPVDFDGIRAIDVAKFGQKVQLSQKTLDELIMMNMADPTDRTWIAEFNRRKLAGESKEDILANPPFGRPQRTVRKRVNIAEASLSTNEKLNAIDALVREGKTETLAQRGLIANMLTQILDDNERINNMNDADFQRVLRAIAKIDMPAPFRDAGIKQRLYDINEYRESQGEINAFLMANFDTINKARGLSGDALLSATDPVQGIGGKSIKLASMERKLREGQYLDIMQRQMLSPDEAERLALTGVDGGFLSGRSVEEEEKKA